MDGRSALVYAVRVEVALPFLRIAGAPDAPLIEWPLGSVTLDETQENIAHVHSALHPLALLSVRDAGLVAALRGCCGQLRGLPGGGRRVPFALACAAAIVVLGGGFYASVPGLSRWVAQRIPLEYERELGAGIAPLLARDYCESEASAQALAELARRLDPEGSGAAEVHVMRSEMVNAFALPGGTVVLTSALIEDAETPDSIAGVLAHELAHVEERHVMSHMVRASLLSAAWSVAVGDYAGLMLLDPSTAFEIVNLRHSRADEAEADRGAARRLDAAGISRRGLIDFFGELREKTDWVPEWLSNHPTSAHRAAELASGAPPGGSPALTPESFEALRAACQ